MSYSDDRRAFTAAAKEGLCPFLTKPGSRRLSADFRRKVLKHLDHAVRHLTGLEGESLLQVDLRPRISELEGAAVAALAAAERDRPSHARCSIRQFLATIYPDTIQLRPRAHARPGFAPLFDALTAEAEREKMEAERQGRLNLLHASGRRSTLYHMQALFEVNGVEAIADIPDDFDKVRGWAEEAGWSQQQWNDRINAYREARKLLPNPNVIPGLYLRQWNRGRGVRSLDLRAELSRRGILKDPRRMSTPEIIRALAPDWADALDLALEWGRAHSRSTQWANLKIDAVSRCVASLIRTARDPANMKLLDLWLPAGSSGQTNDPRITRAVAPYCPGGVYRPPEDCLARILADEQAPSGWEGSPLTLATTTSSSGDAIPYVSTLTKDIQALWGITDLVYSVALSQYQPGLWDTACDNYSSLLTHMSTRNQAAFTRGHMDKLLLMDYGELVCLGLPHLRAIAYARLAALEAYVARPRPSPRRLRTLQNQAHSALEDYIITALITDDGLRIKNYAYAVVGVHIRPEYVRDHAGNPIALLRVTTEWLGFDDPRVRLKRPRDARNAERRRLRTVNRGLVDHELFFRYLTWARPRDAVAAGLIASVEDFDPNKDGYALYIRSRRLPKREFLPETTDEYKLRTGAVNEGELSTVVGRALYRIMRDVLRRTLPDWLHPERTKKWRGIFAAHALRSIITDYFGYYLEEWETASELTNTTRAVLEHAYKTSIGDRAQRLAKIGPENPTYFRQVIDAIQADWGRADWNQFWAHFDSAHPAQHLQLVLPSPDAGPDATQRPDTKLELVA
ncbi:MAG: hypothetical protein ACYC6F_17490 [Longimicrobiales bacterium]